MLICPKCGHNLTPLTVKPDPESSMELDHCYYCGGVWFDHYEINRIGLTEAEKLASHKKMDNTSNYSGNNQCPRDNTKLLRKTGESIPQNVTVLSCPVCNGNFVTQKDLIHLKDAQSKRLDYFKAWNIPLPKLSSILISVLIFSIAIGGVFLTVRNVEKSQEARIKAKETISVPTIIVSSANSVVVSFTTTIPTQSSVVYKAEGEVEPHTIPISIEKSINHTVVLQNLTSQTSYTLKVYIEEVPGEIIGSPTYSFTTN
ncbi:zf-TFIIB domain-containing protein [Candidatus Gottesmanbacteria bacterium]|nr:zf-TFIIB domain-containing protein [Candidatus Gottesmanbacteria bacterium]